MSARMIWAGVSSGRGAAGSGRVGLTEGSVSSRDFSKDAIEGGSFWS